MSKLTIDQTKVLEAIRYFCDKFTEAFPSIPKIAAMAGMCTRKCSDIIRGLVELGRLIRIKRWMKSNMYQIVDPEPVKEEPAEAPKTENADYKRSYKSFKKSFKKDDDEYMQYRINQFFAMAEEKGVPREAAEYLYKDPEIKKQLRTVSWVALHIAFNRLQKLSSNVGHIPSWFQTVLHNADMSVKLSAGRFKTKSAPVHT